MSEYGLWLRRSLAGAVVWLVWVSLVAEVVLFRLGLRVVAVGWLLWVSLWVNDVLLGLGLRCVAVGWQWWVSAAAGRVTGGWLLEGAFRSVAVRRWRMYCVILVVGLRLLGGWGNGAVEWLLWGVWVVLVSICCG